MILRFKERYHTLKAPRAHKAGAGGLYHAHPAVNETMVPKTIVRFVSGHWLQALWLVANVCR